MRLYATGGQRRMALRQYERLRAVLARELGVEASDESRQLYRDILEGRVRPVAPASPQPTVGTARAAVHRTASRRRHNLPVQLSSFVGREREMLEIERLLGRSRTLTLTGPGGAGKTRLAIEAASAQMGGYGAGVWFVDLASVSEPALVIQAIADVFDVREQEGTPLERLVIRHVGEQTLLIVLDNCEHLVDACASIALALLSGCPNLRVIATSRQSLRIPGEVVLRVPSLPVPDPEVGHGPGRPRHDRRRPSVRRTRPGRARPASHSRPPTRTPWPGSAITSTAFRWRSSSPPHASPSCR